MKFIRSRNQFLILENVQQAKAILKKYGLGTAHEDYKKLRELVEEEFKNLNYLGLVTKYRYEQDVSMDELRDLLPWLNQNGGRLKQNPLKYKKFEDLKDEIIELDNEQKIKTIYDLYPREQKNIIDKDSEEIQNKFLKVYEIDKIDQFKQKLSAIKTEENFNDHLNNFIDKYSKNLTEFGTIQKIKKTGSKILYKKEKVIVAEIFDYEASQELGSSNWCISTGVGSWNSYTKGTRRQFFMWDFDMEQSNPNFMIGFTVNANGKITDIHDMRDKSLSGIIPDKVSAALEKMDISMKPFEFRQIILKEAEDNDRVKLIELDDNEKILLFIEKDTYLNNIEFNTFTSFDKMSNNYYIYDFSKELNDNEFFHNVKANKLNNLEAITLKQGNDIVQYIADGDDVKVNELTSDMGKFVLSIYGDKIVPKDVTEYLNERKKEYLERVANISEDDLSGHWGDSEKITETDNQILYKIGYGDHLQEFEFGDGYSIRYDRDFSENSINKVNLYVLINKNLTPTDKKFIQVIYAQEDQVVIYHHSVDEVKTIINKENYDRRLSKDISNLIESEDLILKTKAEYKKQVKEKQEEFWNIVEENYNDSRVEEYGEALYDYLVEDGEIDPDEDGNDFKKVLIPNGEHYDLLEFEVFSYSYHILKQGYASDSYAIGDDDEMDKSAYEYQSNLIDDVGYSGITDVNQFINGKEFAEYFLSDEQNHLEETVREDPEYYLQKHQVDGYDEEYERVENRIEKLEDDIDTNQDDIEEFKKDFKEEEDKQRKADIQDDLNTLQTEISEWEEELEKLKEKLEEMDDEDNDEYWEYREADIEAKAEELYEERFDEVSNDPVTFLNDYYGYDAQQINNMVGDYIDKDEVIKYIIQYDGRTHGLAGYDSEEYDHTYNDEDYYIIIVNKY